MKLSYNFTFDELIESQTARRNEITQQFETPVGAAINLTKLAIYILQPLRDDFNSALFISSGYRCPELNRLIGGAINSDHMRGLAADVTCSDVYLLYQKAAELPFRQLIYYRNNNFIHISYDPDSVVKQKWIQ